MGNIRVIRENPGFKETFLFETIRDAIEYLTTTGYTTLHNPYNNDQIVRMSSRLIDREPGWNARIDTTSDCGCWLAIVQEVTGL